MFFSGSNSFLLITLYVYTVCDVCYCVCVCLMGLVCVCTCGQVCMYTRILVSYGCGTYYAADVGYCTTSESSHIVAKCLF